MSENMDGNLRNEPQLCEKPSENRVPNWHILRLHLICKACYLAQLGPCALLFAIYHMWVHVGPCEFLFCFRWADEMWIRMGTRTMQKQVQHMGWHEPGYVSSVDGLVEIPRQFLFVLLGTIGGSHSYSHKAVGSQQSIFKHDSPARPELDTSTEPPPSE